MTSHASIALVPVFLIHTWSLDPPGQVPFTVYVASHVGAFRAGDASATSSRACCGNQTPDHRRTCES
jgi:hypothetical protein